MSSLLCHFLLIPVLWSPPAAEPSVLPVQAVTPAVSQEIVVTASAIPDELESTPATVSVVSRKEIEERGARDVAEALREVPGVAIARFGSAGKATSLFIRGGNSQHTLVLWNGIEINNPYFSGYDWGQFSAAGVERIEVVRGPYSALYGSDAVSGVVNILTIPERSGFSVDLQTGERGLRSGQFAGAFTSGAWSAHGSIERRDDDGWLENDDLTQTALTGGVRWSGSDHLTVGLFGRYNDYELGIPLNEEFGIDHLVPSLARRQDGRELQLSIPVEGRVGGVRWDATLSRSKHEIELNDPQDPFGLVSQKTQSVANRMNAKVAVPSRTGTWIVGGEWERSAVDDESNFGPNLVDETRVSRSLYVENRSSHSLSRGRLEIGIGARWDDFDTFLSETSPRVGIAWIHNRNKLRASWGQAFRAPSVGELYFPFAGNTDLEPETSRSFEVGLDRAFERGELSITLFRSSWENLIFFDNGSFTFQNVGSAASRGVELGASGGLTQRLRAGMSYTWLDTEQSDTGEVLLRRPEHSGSIWLTWNQGPTAVTLVVVRTGERADIMPVSPYSRLEDDAWTTVDLRVAIDLGPFEPHVKVENLFDERYEEIAGFVAPGRRGIVGLRYRR